MAHERPGDVGVGELAIVMLVDEVMQHKRQGVISFRTVLLGILNSACMFDEVAAARRTMNSCRIVVQSPAHDLVRYFSTEDAILPIAMISLFMVIPRLWHLC